MSGILSKTALASVTFLFTAFVFVNTYEVVFNRDVAFAQSITKVAGQQVINSSVRDFSTKISSEEPETTAPLDGLNQITIPALTMHVKIEEARKVEGEWYQRPSVAHAIGLNKDQYGTTIDYLLYTSKSWRTIPNPDQIEKGMEVNIEHSGGAVSTFEVSEKKILPLTSSLLVGKTEARQVLLVIEDPNSNVYYGFSLVNV
ncbi:MAG TPA: hypothetical protein VD735_07870 [Candidatus Saccharimonadales bacterium]|nr:hypothetical protein [Candidatus Saccharimonadales bacterium]